MEVNWEKFYKEKKAPIRQTNFAESVEAFFIDEQKEKQLIIYDLGAGNGRDTKWLNKQKFFSVIGFDKNNGVEKNNLKYGKVLRISLDDLLKIYGNPDIIYSRFFLHCISNKEIEKIIKNTNKYFTAEFRIKGDKPILYKNHKRNFIDLGWLVNLLLKNNFEILKLQAGRNMAKYKNENPLVARVYAKKQIKK